MDSPVPLVVGRPDSLVRKLRVHMVQAHRLRVHSHQTCMGNLEQVNTAAIVAWRATDGNDRCRRSA